MTNHPSLVCFFGGTYLNGSFLRMRRFNGVAREATKRPNSHAPCQVATSLFLSRVYGRQASGHVWRLHSGCDKRKTKTVPYRAIKSLPCAGSPKSINLVVSIETIATGG